LAIAFVQKQTGRAAGSNSFALALGTNVTAGNFLSACYSVFDAGNPTNTAPTGGGTWATTTAPTAQGEANAFINYAMNATGGATTVTVDYGTDFYLAGSVTEFSGLETASALDQQTSNSDGGSSTPTSGNTGATAQADELVLACVSVSATDSSVGLDTPATTGYTNLHVEQDSLNFMGHASDYKIVAATGAQSAAWGTLDAAYAWSAKIATFKAAAAAGTDPEGSLIGGKLLRGGLLMHGVLVR
jgi:hypothetical protein